MPARENHLVESEALLGTLLFLRGTIFIPNAMVTQSRRRIPRTLVGPSKVRGWAELDPQRFRTRDLGRRSESSGWCLR